MRNDTLVCPECGEHCFEQPRTARIEYIVCFYGESGNAYPVDQEYSIEDGGDRDEDYVCRDCGFTFGDPDNELVTREQFDAADDDD